MKTVIIDTETTGLVVEGAPLTEQPRVIELAALVLTDSAAPKEFSQLYNPLEPLPEEIQKITGLSDDVLRGAPSWSMKEVLRVEELLAGADWIVAHNAPFDITMLGFEFQRVGRRWLGRQTLCTAAAAKEQFGVRPRLAQLYKNLTGDGAPRKAHRAMDDVWTLFEALKAWPEVRDLVLAGVRYE